MSQKKGVVSWLITLAAVVSGLLGSAYAAVPTEVTSALNDSKTDGVQIAGLVLVVIIAIAAFKYIRRAL